MIDPRWRTVLTVAPHLVVGMLVVFTIVIEWGEWADLAVTLLLCAVVESLIIVFRNLRMPWRDHTVAISLFMTALIALNLVLVLRDSWFGFLTIATFSFAYSIVAWPWRLLAVAATAVVAGLAPSSSLGHDPGGVVGTVAIVVVNVAVMCGLAWGLHLARQQQEQSATEGERARLAREIHDTLAQGFVGIITQLQAADQAADEVTRKRRTDAALALARDGLAEARRSVQALRPAALDTVRLPEALASVVQNWSGLTGIHCEMVTSGDTSTLSTDVEVALLRTAQEALANVERHSDAHRVLLTLRADSTGTRLEVCDDGRGFDSSREPGRVRADDGGFGLVAMRQRIESVAGDLVVESSPGRGTAVRAVVPA